MNEAVIIITTLLNVQSFVSRIAASCLVSYTALPERPRVFFAASTTTMLNRTTQRFLSVFAVVVCGFTYWHFSPGLPLHIPADDCLVDDLCYPSPPAIADVSTSGKTFHSGLTSSPPNITIIAIWNPHPEKPSPAYFPNFFASVEGNAPYVNLLFIVFDRLHNGCDKRLSPVTPNIHEICLDTRSYWALHVDYLCGHWKCSSEEEGQLLELLIERSDDDFVRTFFSFRLRLRSACMLFVCTTRMSC